VSALPEAAEPVVRATWMPADLWSSAKVQFEAAQGAKGPEAKSVMLVGQ
jgi:hypothetical protein